MKDFNFTFDEKIEKGIKKNELQSVFIERILLGGFKKDSEQVFSLIGSDYIYINLLPLHYTVCLFSNSDTYEIKKEKYESFNKKPIKNLLKHFLTNTK